MAFNQRAVLEGHLVGTGDGIDLIGGSTGKLEDRACHLEGRVAALVIADQLDGLEWLSVFNGLVDLFGQAAGGKRETEAIEIDAASAEPGRL